MHFKHEFLSLKVLKVPKKLCYKVIWEMTGQTLPSQNFLVQICVITYNRKKISKSSIFNYISLKKLSNSHRNSGKINTVTLIQKI